MKTNLTFVSIDFKTPISKEIKKKLKNNYFYKSDIVRELLLNIIFRKCYLRINYAMMKQIYYISKNKINKKSILRSLEF